MLPSGAVRIPKHCKEYNLAKVELSVMYTASLVTEAQCAFVLLNKLITTSIITNNILKTRNIAAVHNNNVIPPSVAVFSIHNCFSS